MKNLVTLLGIVTVAAAATAFNAMQEDPWKVPEKYETMKNPVKPDAASVSAGKEIYKSHCTPCHGINGKGAGHRSVNLDTKPANFTSEAFQQQTDGALLFKVYFGHREMPGFKNKFPGNEGVSENNFGKTRIPGDLINYLRSYGKK
ncbi:MAG: cytochrome c [Ferruginibacter sp.]